MKEIISTNKAPAPVGAYSQAVITNGLLFISGQIPIDPKTGDIKGDIQLQARQVMENIKALLIESGMGFNNIVKATVYIKNMDDYKIINEVYGSYFPAIPPARETVEVSRLPRNAGLEISVIAAAD